MELTELYEKLNELKVEYKEAKHMLRMQYVKEHAMFKIGDFIGNVTGTIRVEEIGYEYNKRFQTFIITYKGKRYWRTNGELKLTKNQYNPPMRETECMLRKKFIANLPKIK
jgi:hypothetical protein